MNRLIVFLIIGLVLVSCTTTSESQIIQGRQLFNRLNKVSDLGHEIFETIELQLSQSDESDLDKVIGMLQEVRQSVADMANKLSSERDERLGSCLSQTNQIKDSISELQSRISEQKSLLPSRQTQYTTIDSQISSKNDELSFYEQELQLLISSNELKEQNFETRKAELRKLIAALEEARRLIQQLQSQTNFAQTNKVFAQMESHRDSQQQYLTQSHSQKIFGVLMQLAKSVANQDDVNNVIEIIDQLIAAQEQLKYSEQNAETIRLERLQGDKLRYQQNIDQSKTDILEYQAEFSTAKTRLRELERGIEDNKLTLTQKRSQLSDQETYCQSQVSEIQHRGDSYARILEILDQVIFLLENSSIQTAREMIEIN